MSEKENFLEGFKKSDIKKSAELDIKPRLLISSLGVENGVSVKILTEPYITVLPEGKAMTKDGKVWMINVLLEGKEHTFIAQAGSFRYQLGVLCEKHFEGNLANLVGKTIRIWKEIVEHETYGKTEMYQVAYLE